MPPDLGFLYEPLHTLKAVAPDVWVVDGPVIRCGLPWPKLPFPTRMTVVRLAGGLFIHSPTPLVPALQSAVTALGEPRWIIAPNRLHYWWVPEWHAAFADAEVYLAPRVRQQARGRIDFAAHDLTGDSGFEWDEALHTLAVAGRFMTEVEFFHRPSRTLILTDLIQSYEPARLHSGLMRCLTWLGGVQDPHGSMPRDMRLTFRPAALRASVKTMIAWSPEAIILAHGRWYPSGGAAELERAFRWLLD